MLFKKKKEPHEYPTLERAYIQSDNYRGFKRVKLSSYGYAPAQEGIKALTGTNLSGYEIRTILVDKPDSPYLIVMVGKNHVGTLFGSSFDGLNLFRNGSIKAVRLEIRDGDAYLFYKA